MAINKIFGSFEEAVRDIFDGAVLLIGGFGVADGCPTNLIRALAKHDARNLTIVTNHLGYGRKLRQRYHDMGILAVPPDFDDIALLAENDYVRKAIGSFVFSMRPKDITPFQERFLNGELELEVVPQGTLAERIRAAKAGISAFYSPVGPGTIVGQGKETRVFNGRECQLEYAIEADFALIRASAADRLGNLVYRGTSRTFNATMAGAAKVTVAEVDRIVEPGELNPEVIVTPGIYVDRVVKRP